MRQLITGAVLGFLVSLSAAAQTNELTRRQAELQSLRDKVQELEQQINEQQKNERATLELLDTYDRKMTAVRRLIAKLKAGEKQLQGTIEKTRKELEKLEAQLAYLKKQYASYVASVYKSGPTHDIELLLSSASVNQFYIRREYLQRFSEQRKRDVERIDMKRREIDSAQARLQEQLSEERRFIAEKAAEEDRLAALVADRRDVLSQIRKDQRNIQRELNRRLEAARKLEQVIADLIEAERLKKEREAKSLDTRLPQPAPVAGLFEAKKGRLRWPVSQGKVVAQFGEHRHPTLRTITHNTGIDIAVKAGTPVSVVADGEVSMITWYPSYGNLLIVNHYNGYRTVYTHLSEISVIDGQKVSEGDVVGLSGESLEGPRLHFELWKDREKQNPELWLSKQ